MPPTPTRARSLLRNPVIAGIGRALRSLWWLLDAGRRFLLNLLLLGFLVALAFALLRGSPAALQPKTALVLALSGRIAEQQAGSARDSALKQLRGDEEGQMRLRDLLAVLDAAAQDNKITHALLLTDGLAGAGLVSLREVAAALDRFRAAGKPVIAWGSDFEQRGYFLAAHASEVWLHPMGGVTVEGYGGRRSYYKDLLDRVGVSANVVRAGKFKNAGETYTASGPSSETQQADAALYDALWASFTGGVEGARKLPAGSVMQAIDSLPASLLEAGGDSAKWALERKWVDALKTRDEMRQELIARGAKDDKTFRQVHWRDYLGRIQQPTGGDAVAVVVAEGSIGEGQAGPGSIGGRSTGELIRRARDDERIKALVLRVNSPGGSAFGSELVRHELELTRAAGKPVVVSMGDVAASGGYWISLAADEVIADEATITGSIGVVTLLPTAQGLLDKIGVRTAGQPTTWLAGAYDPRRGLEPRFAQLVQAGVDHVYRDFLARAATARKTTPDKIDAVAQGRVWAGRDALEKGLVDRLGSFGDALRAAAQRGKLADGHRVVYLEAEPGRWEALLRRFGLGALSDTWSGALGGAFGGASGDAFGDVLGSFLGGFQTAPDTGVQALLGALGAAVGAPSASPPAWVAVGALAMPAATQALWADLAWLAELGAQRRPWAAAAHCLCTSP